MLSWEICDQLFQKYRWERFVLKTVKLSSTISKVSLLRSDNQPASAKHKTKLVSKSGVYATQIAGPKQMVKVAKEWSKTLAGLAQVLCYDLFDYSPHCWSHFTSPHKARKSATYHWAWK